MQRLRYIKPITSICNIDKEYRCQNQSGMFGELSKYFDLVVHKEDKEKVRLKNFFRNALLYRKKILGLPKDDLFFVDYPYKRISILLSFLLRKRKLVIWVKTDSVGIQRSNQFQIYGFGLRAIIYTIINPFKSLAYIMVSRVIFKDNLIFYSGNITINPKNHFNQHEIISCSEFNKDKSLVKKERNYNIVFVGKEANQRKGMHILLKAVRESHLKNRLIINIIGSEKFKIKRNKKLAKGLNIKFHGRMNDRDKFYKILSQNDILVMPSFGEKQGKVQLEAMSVGAVPICSDSGGTYKTVKNYYNGLLFKPGNYKELKEKIESLYNNDSLYDNMRKNGLEYVSTLSVEKQAKEMAASIKNFYSEKN